MNEAPPERRTRPVAPLQGDVLPASVRALIADRPVVQRARIVSITDRTMVVELDEAASALAVSLAPEVEVDFVLAGSEQTAVARPGRRVEDNPTSHRVEMVILRSWSRAEA